MKRNPLILLLTTCICIITSLASAQESNYITSKYDFIPGEKVIFFDDFSSESIGDFPAQWLTNGSGEIVTSQKFPGKWFNITKMGYYIPEAKEDFTENFTIEFDFIPMTTDNGDNLRGFTFYLLTGKLGEPGGGGEPGDAGFQIVFDEENLGWKNWSMASEQRFNGNVTFPFKTNQKYHVAIWVQKQRVRIYANENKVLDVPRGIPTGSEPNILRFETRDEAIPLIGSFRIAAGMSDMRNLLLKNGKIISYGILFDVNSDKLKPESYSTLKVISDILKEDPALKLQVVGHTDSDGDDASNLDLSKRRAVSVKNELVSKFGADAARLETDGKGESEPITDNNSSVNKAKNRRVEFININKSNITTYSTTSEINVTVVATGGLTDIDGNSYKIVTIGSQIWMAENLKTTKFNDGSPIPYVPIDAEWGKMESPAYCWMNNEEKYKNTYGALYNWYTVGTLKLCPSGWHIPDEGEWEVLRQYLSGDEGSDNAGGMLKESGTVHWTSPNLGATNETGFTGLPGGGRGHDGSFDDDIYGFGSIGTEGSWWSYTKQAQSGSYYMMLKSDSNGLFTGASSATSYGISARCVKDK
jgi:OOP family OmpA-OmpF porin